MTSPHLQFVCSEGCGVCTVRLVDFEWHRTTDHHGNLIESQTHPTIVSACCGGEVDIWDDRLETVVGHVDVSTPVSA